MLENVQFFGENKQIFLEEILENVQFFGENKQIFWKKCWRLCRNFRRNVGE